MTGADAVVLDYFGTLTPTISRRRMRESVDKVADELGVDRSRFHEEFVLSWPERSRGATGDTHDTLRLLAERVGRVPDPARLASAVSVRLAEYRLLAEPRPEAVGVVETLRSWGLGVGVASDCGSELAELWDTLPLSGRVDAAVLSWELRVGKPLPAVFSTIARRLGVPAVRCWYVGDGGSDELAGARRAGMTPVWLRSPGSTDAFVHGFSPGDGQTAVIERLDDLPAMLERTSPAEPTHMERNRSSIEPCE